MPCTLWGDLLNRPVYGFVKLGNARVNNSRHILVHAFANRSNRNFLHYSRITDATGFV
jgi:hypothetical protein